MDDLAVIASPTDWPRERPFARLRRSFYRWNLFAALRRHVFGASLAIAALAGPALVLPACGSKQNSGPDGVLVATQRLQGKWLLKTFVPESQLEAPLQGLLNAELGQMTVTITGADYTAVGPGINITGRLRIDSAEGDLWSGAFIDSTGVAYRVSGQFDGATFRFRSYDAPWRGQGTLERAAN